jgi:hypothetical protein
MNDTVTPLSPVFSPVLSQLSGLMTLMTMVISITFDDENLDYKYDLGISAQRERNHYRNEMN